MVKHGSPILVGLAGPGKNGSGCCLPASNRQAKAWTGKHAARQRWVIAVLVALCAFPVSAGAQSIEDLPDLTGGVIPVLIYETRDPFSSDAPTSLEHVHYSVRVKNQTGDPVIGDTLVLVVDRIVALNGDDVLSRITVRGADGYTADGKPYFRVPIANGPDLAPFAESEPLTLRLENPDYLRFFPPTLRVRGIRRSPEKSVQHLLDTLVEKGILTPEEARKSLAPPIP